MGLLSKITNWKFLDETLISWFVFIIALSLMMFAWRTILQRVSGAI